MGLFNRDDDDGGKTMLWTGGSRTILAFVDAAKKRKRFIAIGAAVVTVVVAVVAFVVMRYAKAEAAARVVEGYSALTRCLLGEQPTKGESASLRFRRIQLTVLTSADVKRTPSKGEPWPDRCARYAHMLHEGLEKSAIGEGQGQALLGAATALGEHLDKKQGYWQDPSENVDATFAEAAKTGIALTVQPDVPTPPAATMVPSTDQLDKAAELTNVPIALGHAYASVDVSAAVRFVLDDPKLPAPLSCVFTASGGGCQPLPASVAGASKGGLRVLGTATMGATGLLAAGGGGDGIFAGSDQLGAAPAIGGWMGADGTGAALVVGRSGPELWQLAGKSVKRSSGEPGGGMKLADARRDAALLFGQAVFLAQKGDDLLLAAGSIGARGIGAVAPIGTLAGATLSPLSGTPRLEGCDAGGTVVVRARTTKDFLAFWLGNRYSQPLVVPSTGGVLSCHSGEATLTRVDPGSGETTLGVALTHHRCTPTECQTSSLSLRDLLSTEAGLAPAALVLAVGLDGKLLVVWQAGQRGGIRMRLAEARQIASTEDVVVLDDLVDQGKVVDRSTVLDLRLLPANGFALLLLNTDRGVRALRISADGKVTAAGS